MTLEGKHVLITGASGGLGDVVARSFLSSGATCHFPCIETSSLDSFSWAGHERTRAVSGVDLTDENAVVQLYSDLPALWASVHLVGGFAMAPLCETSLDDFERMHKLNAVTCFLCCREAVKAMRKNRDGGRIVNVVARPVLDPVGGMLAYSSSKATVASMTQTLAAELRDEGIWVNAIVPSIIDTPANRKAMPDADFSTWPKPAELADAIYFLASPQNHNTSGCLLPVFGRA